MNYLTILIYIIRTCAYMYTYYTLYRLIMINTLINLVQRGA